MKVLNLMKKINLLLILVLFSALCTGCTKHIVIKFNDYNELMRGTITSNNSKNILIKVKVDSNGVTCSGKSKITNKTAANHLLPTYRGLEGNIMLRCDDGRSKYLEWKILNLGLSNFRGVGEDALGNKLSFFVDNNEKKVNDKFEQYKKNVTGKSLLKDAKPVAFNKPLNLKSKNEELTDLAPITILRTKESNLEPYVNEQNKNQKLTRYTPLPTLMELKPTVNSNKQEQNKNLNLNLNMQQDFKPYLADLERRIKTNWVPPKGKENKRAEVLFKVERDGRLVKSRIYKSSGFPNYDYAALKAVETAAPFRPLPQEFKEKSIDVMFTFDYHLLEHPPLNK